jgi:hypothetical protein
MSTSMKAARVVRGTPRPLCIVQMLASFDNAEPEAAIYAIAGTRHDGCRARIPSAR